MCRYRRRLVADRVHLRQRIHKPIDREGLRVEGVHTDTFGRNGRKVLDGLVQGHAAR